MRDGRSGARRRGRRRRHSLLVTTIVVAVLLAGAGIGAAFALTSPSGRAHRATPATTAPKVLTTTTTTPPPPPPVPPVYANGPRDRPAVALTFDSNLTDAMIGELNAGRVASFANIAVIDELDRLQVPATIFLAGKWMERYPDVTRRLAADPLFELASHSYAHRAYHQPCYGLGTLAAPEMAPDVAHSEALLRQFTARPSPYFRFPGGCYDDAALHAIAPTGVTVIQYDLASGDAFGTSVRAIVNNVLANTHNGSIVVMHITGGNTAPLTAYAVPPIVAGLRQRGFQLVKVSDLLAPLDGSG